MDSGSTKKGLKGKFSLKIFSGDILGVIPSRVLGDRLRNKSQLDSSVDGEKYQLHLFREQLRYVPVFLKKFKVMF